MGGALCPGGRPVVLLALKLPSSPINLASQPQEVHFSFTRNLRISVKIPSSHNALMTSPCGQHGFLSYGPGVSNRMDTWTWKCGWQPTGGKPAPAPTCFCKQGVRGTQPRPICGSLAGFDISREGFGAPYPNTRCGWDKGSFI